MAEKPLCPACKRDLALPKYNVQATNSQPHSQHKATKCRSLLQQETINCQQPPQQEEPHCQGLSQYEAPICPDCDLPFKGFWLVGWREGILAQLISDFKYNSVRATSRELADLLNTAISAHCPKNLKMTIVPLPTIGRHIRERGLDHTALLARKLARLRDWEVEKLLVRTTDTVQVGAKVSQRKAQAAQTYALKRPLDPNKNYLLLDDVWTTGSSMLAAAKVLQTAGAKNLYGAVVAVSGKEE